MKNMTLQNMANAVNGELHIENIAEGILKDSTLAKGVVLDSRKVEEGYIFVATRGERVDGHSFIDSVFEKGAMGVICEQAPQNPKGAYILVKDSFQALKDLAAFYRQQLNIKVVGITGSVGKTSTKEFIASVLEQKYITQKTQGNFNNEVGLPLTVLGLKQDCRMAVLEMGISDFGEMHRLSSIAKPDTCVITNIGQCHLENLGTRDGILKAKTEIFDFMNPEGNVCLNGGDDKLITVKEVHGKKPLFFGMNKSDDCEIYATEYINKGLDGSSVKIHVDTESLKEEFYVHIPLPGEHMVYNALAATAVGITYGLNTDEIKNGIEKVQAVGGRSNVIRSEKYTIIDDCYNANPVSMKAAIDLMASTPVKSGVKRIAVLGDMFELGTDEKQLHYEVGQYAAQRNLEIIICIGDLCKNLYEGAKSVENTVSRAYYYVDKESFLDEINNIISNGDIILIKASHGMHFEEIVNKL
ncbi:MAG: UDP-N-acetylmuramoyl-tripeptide--D-alanyl-D-alanine ligase [Lachnospiraceae bacterium]|nr:UDP-N-acetylmuramoyl-tripeptide--D-alanyl-D-alanine ligase [Lachnospiraceae bacterium]